MKKLLIILFTIISFAAAGQHQYTKSITASGTNTYTAVITVPTPPPNYSNLVINGIKFQNANSTASTLNITNITGAGAVALRMWDGDSWEVLTGGELDVNTVYTIKYQGSYFEVFGAGSSGGGSFTLTPGNGTTVGGDATSVDQGGSSTDDIDLNISGFSWLVRHGTTGPRAFLDSDKALMSSNNGGVYVEVGGVDNYLTLQNDLGSDASSVQIRPTGFYLEGSLAELAGDALTVPTSNSIATKSFVEGASTTGNAATATALATGRTISISGDLTYTSPSFDGTGNVTAAGTLATVNSNVGSFGSSTSIPSFTVNGKGLVTAASGNAVIAPAGTLTGTTLNSSVVTSSLTSVATIGTGVWNGTRLTNGFTPQGSGLSVWGVTGSSTADQASIVGTANQILRVNGAGSALAFGSIDLSQSATVGSSILPVANGGTGSATAPWWSLTGTSTVTTPTISGNVSWTQSSQSSTNTFQSFTQAAHTGGTPTGFLYTGGAHTTLANASTPDLNFNLSRTVQFGQNTTLALQTAALFDLSALTYSSSAATKTITKTIGVQIKGAPAAGTNATITNAYPFAYTDNSDNVEISINPHNSNFGALIFGSVSRASAPSIGAASNPTTFSPSGNNFKFQSGSVAANGRAGFSFASTSTIGFPSGTSTNSWIYSGTGISLSNSGASATHNHLDLQPTTAAVTAGTSFTLNVNNIAPVIDINAVVGAAIVRGGYYNPTQTTVGSNVTNKAWEHTSGYVQWNSVLTPSQITSNQNDYNPTGWTNGGAPNGASILRLDTDASRNITSLAGGLDGRLVVFSNKGSNKVTFTADDGSSGTAANRFVKQVSLNAGESALGFYDNTTARWRINKNTDGQYPGTTTNDAATAGNIGENFRSIVSTYTNYTTTATYQNITSITLPAGDYEISAQFTFSSNGATITAASDAIFVISTTTASASGSIEGESIAYIPQAALLGTSHESSSIAPYRVSLSGSTTYYLNTQASFTLGNPQFVGSIRALRVR